MRPSPQVTGVLTTSPARNYLHEVRSASRSVNGGEERSPKVASKKKIRYFRIELAAAALDNLASNLLLSQWPSVGPAGSHCVESICEHNHARR